MKGSGLPMLTNDKSWANFGLAMTHEESDHMWIRKETVETRRVSTCHLCFLKAGQCWLSNIVAGCVSRRIVEYLR